MRRLLLLLTATLQLARPADAETAVDLELVLLSDASGSIDASQIRLQRQGWAAASTDPEILQAIAVQPFGRIAATFVAWGDVAHRDVVVPWMAIEGKESAETFAVSLFTALCRAFGRNAIGSALLVAERRLETNGIAVEHWIVDLSAGSPNSFEGPPLEPVRARLLANGITMNGLGIACGDPDCSGRPVGCDLAATFPARIIGGPASFVVTADRRTSFAEVARRKVLLEVAGGTSGRLVHRSDPGLPPSALR